MKLNNYQKILVSWGILLLTGYMISILVFSQIYLFFTMWLIIAIIGLIIQFKFGGFAAKSTKLIQAIWIIIILGGIFLNYFEYIGIIPLFGNNPFISWPIVVGLAYLLIAIIYKLNVGYLILAISYGVFAGVMFFIQDFTLGLVVSGLLFAILCLKDAFLENSSLRKRSLLN